LKANITVPSLFEKLPPGLTIPQVAKRFRVNYQTARRLIKMNLYLYTDGRHFGQLKRRKFNPAKADWRKSNVAIAKQFCVSRERVRVVRGKLGHPFIESRGRKPLKRNIKKSS
jgi:hypothetical protein